MDYSTDRWGSIASRVPTGQTRSRRLPFRPAAGGRKFANLDLPTGRCFGGQVMAIVLPGKERSVSMVAGDAWTMLFRPRPLRCCGNDREGKYEISVAECGRSRR